LAISRGKWIAFLDSDDLWAPEKLELQLLRLESCPEASLCYCDYRFVNMANMTTERSNLVLPATQEQVFAQFLTGCPISPCSVLIRSSCLPPDTRFDPGLSFGEDWDLLARLAAKYLFVAVPNILLEIRKHSGNMTSVNVDSRIRDYLRVIDKIFSLPAAEPHRHLKATVKADYMLQAAYHLMTIGRHAGARPWIFRSMYLQPFSMQAWKALARTIVPRSLVARRP
jgi:hypothetical protein